MCSCGHPRQSHMMQTDACRMNGCPCTAFYDGVKPIAKDERVVVIEIPEGYELNFTLTPVRDGT